MEPKRLYRSTTDRKFAGVAGGLAEYFLIDPLLIRLVFVILTLAGGGGFLIYLVLWIVTPEQPFTPLANNHPSNSDFQQPDQPSGNQMNESTSATTEPNPGMTSAKQPEKNKGSLIGGLVLITLGGLFLADELIPGINFGDLWPVILIVVGVGLLLNTIAKRNKNINQV